MLSHFFEDLARRDERSFALAEAVTVISALPVTLMPGQFILDLKRDPDPYGVHQLPLSLRLETMLVRRSR